MNEVKDRLERLVVVADTSIAEIDDLNKKLAQVDTPELVAGYNSVKKLETKVKAFTDAARKELLYGGSDDYDGRFFAENVLTDEKGNRFLNSPSGEVLKAEKRVSVTFDPDKAKALLEALDRNSSDEGAECLVDEATETNYVIHGEGIVETLEDMLSIANELSNSDLILGLRYVLDELESERTAVIAEDKVEALVVLGKVPVDVAEAMYNENVVYALKVQAPKKTAVKKKGAK